ncbi:MAG: fluoride efflux transporter CrcB [Melioribacteraceae bacterium]|nr:fluoride efflux transporter CrcB [Melioribacteraceae bacterium]MCF8355630.1 fluoride efflux transporter CrcB [Melioribacteraceae bacterium]MCF8394670.1 fluoride efflux transporter CrcB [Melioribacteraceae bacterium]MCF8417996.1 fluoride efflux transporter CrcB [Melioribacteraceae bacterium]
MKYLIVAIGAGIGGGLRFYISALTYKFISTLFPYGTLAVNVIGSIILGILIFGFDEKELISQNMKLFLAVGFCGGFTTFSTFSLETFNLVRESQFFLAGANVFLNFLLTLLGVYIGYLITR